MKILKPEIEIGMFRRQLAESDKRLLMLDYDGTLAPFDPDPDKAFPYPDVVDMLNSIMKSSHVNLVIVSGRWTRDLMPLLNLDRMPEIWGCHGLERLREDGSHEVVSMEEKVLEGLVLAEAWLRGTEYGGRSEKKPGCLAIHWRGADPCKIDSIKEKTEEKWHSIAQAYGLDLKEFDGGLELRVPGRNKGDAVRTLLNESPDNTAAAYLGDDATDEDAFNAIKGRGIGILVRNELRPTAADIWIKPPEELIEFLDYWISETGKE